MKKISYSELGEYIGSTASEYFGKYYSSNIHDYADEISNCNSEYDEVNSIYNCNIELVEKDKQPLIIKFKYKDILDENENVIDTIYYI